MFSYEVELRLELNDDELRRLDYYLSKTEDDMFRRAEGFTLLSDKMEVTIDNLNGF
jgi:hypothetical protein